MWNMRNSARNRMMSLGRSRLSRVMRLVRRSRLKRSRLKGSRLKGSRLRSIRSNNRNT